MRWRLALLLVGAGLLAGCPEHSAPALDLRAPDAAATLADGDPPAPGGGRELYIRTLN